MFLTLIIACAVAIKNGFFNKGVIEVVPFCEGVIVQQVELYLAKGKFIADTRLQVL